VEGKRVVVVDDSIVRGHGAARVVNLREAGAKEVHMRVSCPPHRFGLPLRNRFPRSGKLIANQMPMMKSDKYLGVDQPGYLDVGRNGARDGEAGKSVLPRVFHRNYPLPLILNSTVHHGKNAKAVRSSRGRGAHRLCLRI